MYSFHLEFYMAGHDGSGYVEGKATVNKFNTFQCEHQNDFEASFLFLYIKII